MLNRSKCSLPCIKGPEDSHMAPPDEVHNHRAGWLFLTLISSSQAKTRLILCCHELHSVGAEGMRMKAIPHPEHKSEVQGLRDKPVSCPNTDDSNRTLIIPSPLCLQAPAHVAGQPITPSVTAPQLPQNSCTLTETTCSTPQSIKLPTLWIISPGLHSALAPSQTQW